MNYILDRFESELLVELKSIGGEMERMRKRKAELQSEIARLTAGLATGIHSTAVMEEIARREREISDISDRLLSSDPESIHSRVKNLRAKALVRVRDLRQYLTSDTPTARAYLARHVEKILMDPAGGRYVASGGWNLLGEGRWDGAEGQS